jgi:ribosome-associated protein
MKNTTTNGLISIPEHELEITASRAGGPGGQHVNKTSTRITIRWNVTRTTAFNDMQKERLLEKLRTELTNEGDLIVHSGATRSQQRNKEQAINELTKKIRSALHVRKKRIKTAISQKTKESVVASKRHRSAIKKMRSKKFDE